MDIRKEPGGVARHSPDREDMVLINRLAREELTAEQVYTFSLRLCDNEIDRDSRTRASAATACTPAPPPG